MKQTMTFKDIQALAETARIELTSAEKAVFPEEISVIMALAEVFDEVDVGSVSPTVYPLEQSISMRADEVEKSLPHEDAVANGPDVVDGYFRVPRIIEEDD